MKYFDPPRKYGSVVRWGGLAAAALLALALAGCGGSDGAPGATGPAGPAGPAGQDVDPATVAALTEKINALTQSASPETCVMCHTGSEPLALPGSGHQAEYNKYKDASKLTLTIDSVATTGAAAPYTSMMTFTAKKSGVPLTAAEIAALGQKTFYAVTYNSATRKFDTSFSYASSTALKNAATYVATGTPGQYKVTTTAATFKPEAPTTTGAQAYAYIADGVLKTESMTLYDDVANAGLAFGDVASYGSAANVAGCEKCHGAPYMKHGYRNPVVDGLAEFASCKACHYDLRNGGHQFWQMLGDAKHAVEYAAANPTDTIAAAKAKELGDRVAAINGGAALTQAEKDKYAYKANLMNDVHMAHAMEFAYPQSMKNCVTCHEGKLDAILADEKFTAETCKSCHSVDGIKAKMAGAAFNHGTMVANLETTNCVLCHKTTGGAAPAFKTIHGGGFDPKIYSTTGVRYSDTFVAKVDSASIAGNKLTIKFSATGALGSLSASNITPTVMVGLYGYDSKDFIVAAHGSAADKQRNLEYVWDGTATNNAKNRFTQIAKTTAAGTTTWELTADLSLWADMITARTIKRAEIVVMPELKDASGLILGLNAPSRTFDLVKNAFDDGFYKDIVDVKGCNTCHDQLATTFHSGIRGGNIKVCRTCHVVSSGGSHLELQSRSIDSYVHAIHSFQAFDIKNVDFTDPFAKMEYEHHVASTFPNFTIMNCEACHKPGTYDIPSQAKSMPGVLSASNTLKAGSTRNIGSIPSYVSGPAARACGACHLAQKINADDAAGLAVSSAHFKSFGYLVEASTGVWDSIVAKMMAIFK